MKEITVTLPAIDETIIEAIEAETTLTVETEATAIAAIRERYASLARQNGHIRVSYSHRSNSNYSNETETYYRDADGRKVKALLCVDNFTSDNTDQNRGRYLGSRLYLTANGEWLKITRDGNWSSWQGESTGWACGYSSVCQSERNGAYDEGDEGSIDVLTDARVSKCFALATIVDGLGESLKTMSEKLPGRLTKVRERATLASALLAALK